jgi:hypothetical protein
VKRSVGGRLVGHRWRAQRHQGPQGRRTLRGRIGGVKRPLDGRSALAVPDEESVGPFLDHPFDGWARRKVDEQVVERKARVLVGKQEGVEIDVDEAVDHGVQIAAAAVSSILRPSGRRMPGRPGLASNSLLRSSKSCSSERCRRQCSKMAS